MTPQAIIWALTGVLVFNYVTGHLLELLNLSRMRTEVPGSLRGMVSPEKYGRAQQYSRTRTHIGLITSTVSFSLTMILLFSGFFGWLDNTLRTWTEEPFLLALCFFVSLYAVTESVGLPFHAFNTFVIEERFGFNKLTPVTFIADKVKVWMISFALGAGILWVFIRLQQWLGEPFWLWFWAVMVVVVIVYTMVYPSALLIFNKLSPLPEGSLRDAITRYCHKVGFPVAQISVIDASRRSTKTNAFFTGFGRRRIVLYDTLVKQHSEEEIVAILAHEVGHYRRHHMVQRLLLTALQIGLMLFLFSQIVSTPALSLALGAEKPGIHLNLLAFVMLYSPLSHLVAVFVNVIFRRHEFEADHFAAETADPSDVKVALVKLYQHNLTNLTPHPIYVFVNYSHPPLMSRITALENSPSDRQVEMRCALE